MSNTKDNSMMDSTALGAAIQKWSGDIIYVIDKIGVVRGGNDRMWSELYHMSASLEPMSLLKLVVEEDRTFVLRNWETIMSHRAVLRSIRKVKTEKGMLKVLSVIESPILESNTVDTIIGIGRDITEEFQLEDKLWSDQENREAALEYAVRASMGLVKGYVYSLQRIEGMPNDKRSRFSRIIAEEVDTMGRNIDNLLLSRGEGNVSGESTIFDVSEVIAECIELHSSESTRRQITVEYTKSENDVNFFGQPMAVLRVVCNIIDYCMQRITHSGTISVHIEDSEEYIEISVSDSGAPVTPEQLENLMNTSRVTDGRANSVVGSAFDLDVARLLTESMGGGVMPHANSGGGLEFTIMLPRFLQGTNGETADVTSQSV